MKEVYKISIGLILAGAEMFIRFLTELCSWFGVELLLGKSYPGIVLTDGLRSFGISTIENGLSGDFLGVECPLTVIGLCLIAWGCFSLRQYHRRFPLAAKLALGSAVCYIALKAEPFLFVSNQETGTYLLIGLILIQILLEAAMLFSIAKAMGKQVDAYLYMELEQDLQFAFQLYAASAVVTYILSVFRALDLVQIFFMIGSLGCVGALVYYSVRMYSYTKKLKLFAD